jgi:hypothetical protein
MAHGVIFFQSAAAGFQSAAAEKSHGAAEKSHGAGQKFYAAAELQSTTSIFQFFNFSILQFFNFPTCGLRAGYVRVKRVVTA